MTSSSKVPPKTVWFTGFVVKQDNGKYVVEIPTPDQIELVRKKMIDVPLDVRVTELDENALFHYKGSPDEDETKK